MKEIKTEIANELDTYEFTRALRDYVQAGNNLLKVWENIPTDGIFGQVLRQVTWPFNMSFDDFMVEMKKVYNFIYEEFSYEPL
jgi:hypothetical protein